jgi:oxygen-independent coproporphyrinogen-3 oxidase
MERQSTDSLAAMRNDVVQKYDLRVPRYTSYPTVPHFGPQVDADVYGGWLAGLGRSEAFSLYLHVPFCDRLCWFCGCHTKIVRRYDPVAKYLDALDREITLVADNLGERMPVRHVHWGGGSPSLMRDSDWLRLMGRLGERFAIRADAEIAVELDPRDIRPETAETLARAGINRASLGVQDFDAHVQRAINRVQSFEETERVIGWLQDAGISAFNLDLMYGLPHQTALGVARTADMAADLAPGRMALFGYAHVPWMKANQRLIDEAALPSADERWDQIEAATAALKKRGYVAIGLDHFAKSTDPLAAAAESGHLHRNFQGYTTDTAATLLGFGASAIGSLPQGYAQNAAPIAQYMRAVSSGQFAITRGIALSDDDRLRREIIERLMCDMEVDVGAACRRHGVAVDSLAGAFAAIAPLVDDGIAERKRMRIRITEDGRPFVRLVAAAFDAYLNRGETRHAKAI